MGCLLTCETLVSLIGKPRISSNSCNLGFSGSYLNSSPFSPACFFPVWAYRPFPSWAACPPLPPSPTGFYSVPAVLLAFLITPCSNPACSSSSIQRVVRTRERTSSLLHSNKSPSLGPDNSLKPSFKSVSQRKSCERLLPRAFQRLGFSVLAVGKKPRIVLIKTSPQTQLAEGVLCRTPSQRLTSGERCRAGRGLAVPHGSGPAAGSAPRACGGNGCSSRSGGGSQVGRTFCTVEDTPVRILL